VRQLNGMDVSFLNLETDTVFAHVSSLNIYDPSGAPGGAGLAATKALILSRMDRLLPFRRRLITVPLGLDLPYWIEDAGFDIDYHVRHHAVPPPGTPEQLADVVSRIIARPLDRSRPLWELYVIEGYDGGRLIAQLTKVHHAAVDGAAGALMLAAILDTDPGFRPEVGEVEFSGEAPPSTRRLLGMTAREYLVRPEKMVRTTVQLVRQLAATTGSRALSGAANGLARPVPGPMGRALRERLHTNRQGEDELPPAPSLLAPRTPFNASITAHRRFAFTSIDLERARAVRRAFGVTFNDVVMALCSGALRAYLLGHDALPDKPLIAMVPISVRTGDEADLYQNRVSALFADLATDEADPLTRLRRIGKGMNAAKERFKTVPAEALQDFTEFAPPAIAARAIRLASRLRIADHLNPPVNLVISNVPGPNHPLYSAGAELLHFFPVSMVTDGIGLNITVQSYNGSLDFGFVADRELVPDVWSMVDLLHEAMGELLTLSAPAAPPARKQSARRRPA
jgi:diacylglycerol O-acyltransferase / wax synthase